jgi:hypothetical protein
MPFRFLHTADIHLDSPLRSLAMRDPELAALIGGSTRQVLVGIVDLCLEERVNALVVAGDLYDGDQTSMKTARFLADQMRRLHEAGIVVYKVPGQPRRAVEDHTGTRPAAVAEAVRRSGGDDRASHERPRRRDPRAELR